MRVVGDDGAATRRKARLAVRVHWLGAALIAATVGVGLGCEPEESSPPCTDCQAECDDGWADCNGDPEDGCEAALASSKDACGACGVRCGDLPGALAAECVAGACAVYGCEPGLGDCNQDPKDGCEVDTTKAAGHCGGCGRDCSAGDMAHATDVACVAGECAFSCKEGFVDCNGDVADGCEADLQTDDDHCGGCFQDCILGPCAGGRCVPVTVVPDAGIPVDLAVDLGDLYWVDTHSTAGAVRRVSPFAPDAVPGDVETFVEGQLSPIGVAVDNQFVYWTTWGDDLVQRRARNKSGSNEVLGVGPFADPAGITVVPGAVYWADLDYMGTSFAIYRVSLGSGATVKMQAPSDHVSDVVVTEDAIYWGYPTLGLQTASLTPLSPPGTALAGVAPGFLAADENHLYFSEGKSIKRVALNLSSNTIEEVATVDTNTYGVALDPYFVYFTARDPMTMAPGKIYRVRKPW